MAQEQQQRLMISMQGTERLREKGMTIGKNWSGQSISSEKCQASIEFFRFSLPSLLLIFTAIQGLFLINLKKSFTAKDETT